MRSPTALDDWRQAITDGIRQWNATLAVECEFTRYDDLFAAAPPIRRRWRRPSLKRGQRRVARAIC